MHRYAADILLFALPVQAYEHLREFAGNNGKWFDNLERPDNEQHHGQRVCDAMQHFELETEGSGSCEATRLDYSLSSSRGFAPLDEGQAGMDRRRRTVLDARSGLLELDENLKALEFLRFGAHIALNRRPQHASNRPSTQGWDFLLSSLRSDVFGDAFAAAQERRQYCEMRGLQANDGRAGQGSSLQAHSSA
jgi:hypothetical protein